MRLNKLLKLLCILLAVVLIPGLFQMSYSLGTLDAAEAEYRESAFWLEKAVNDNERDLSTDTLNYDTYKAALNGAAAVLKEGEQLVHINVGFGSLDRGLKFVNDTYGHLNGKPTILNFANLLKEVFPAEEGWVIAHRGGSGFLAYCVGQFDEEKILGYYEKLKERWHDTPYEVPNGKGVVDGMALLFLASVAPDCGRSFRQLRDELAYKKLALRDVTNCGYVIETSPDHYISSVEIDETAYMED